MPIYEYRCRVCGRVAEFLVGSGESKALSCPDCGSRDLEKVISLSAFLGRAAEQSPGRTCCGREERCDKPPCSSGAGCRRDPG